MLACAGAGAARAGAFAQDSLYVGIPKVPLQVCMTTTGAGKTEFRRMVRIDAVETGRGLRFGVGIALRVWVPSKGQVVPSSKKAEAALTCHLNGLAGQRMCCSWLALGCNFAGVALQGVCRGKVLFQYLQKPSTQQC